MKAKEKVEIQVGCKIEQRQVFTIKEFTTKASKKRAKLTHEQSSEDSENIVGTFGEDVRGAIEALASTGVEEWHCYRYPDKPSNPWVIYWRHPLGGGMRSDANGPSMAAMFRAAARAETKRQRNAKLFRARQHLGQARAALYEMGLDDTRELIFGLMEDLS